jgi:hypothetical protein
MGLLSLSSASGCVLTRARSGNGFEYLRHGTPAKDRGRYRKRGRRWCLAELF